MSDVKIKIIDSDKLINAINEGSYDVNLSTVMALGAVISTQPERIRGRWIKMSDADGTYYCCSECGNELYRRWVFDREFDPFPQKESIPKTSYCPDCGADMRENNNGLSSQNI